MSAKLQLSIKGAENSYLSYKPTNSLFQSCYKRLSNFAIESDSISPNNGSNINFGSTIEFNIPPNGHLLSNLYLRLDVRMNSDIASDVEWVNTLGHAIISSVELKLSNTVLATLNGKLLDILSEFIPSDKRKGYEVMVGKKNRREYFNNLNSNFTRIGNRQKTLIIPLNFWFTRHISNAFPLFRLRKDNLKVIVKLNTLNECIVRKENNEYGDDYTYDSKIKAELITNSIYLENDELKTLISRKKTVHIIEQYQYEERKISKYEKNVKIDLKFNHPVKGMYWVIQRNDRNDYIVQDPMNNDGGGLDHYENIHYENDEFNYSYTLPYFQPITESYKMDDFETENEAKMFNEAKINFNNKTRNKFFNSEYYKYIQPYQHHTVIPKSNIFNYNFSINSDHFQPNGFCNFTPISNVSLEINMENTEEECEKTAYIYAINYNIIKFENNKTNLIF